MIGENISTKQKILAVAVIISLIGISSLYLFSSENASRKMSISKIDENLVGTRIATEGNISEITWFSYMVLFELKEKGCEDSLTVTCNRDLIKNMDNEKKQLRTGAKVEVEGKLKKYEGKINLKVDSHGEVSVVRKAYSSFTPISHLLENPRWHEGMHVKVRGKVVEITNITDGTDVKLTGLQEGRYKLECRVKDAEGEVDQKLVGKPVVLKGKLTYDSKNGHWRLKCSRFSGMNSR